MIAFVPIAAVEGGVFAAIVAVIIVINFFVRLASQIRQAQQGPPRPPVPRPQPRRDPLTDEIERFLQEAQRRRSPPGQPACDDAPCLADLSGHRVLSSGKVLFSPRAPYSPRALHSQKDASRRKDRHPRPDREKKRLSTPWWSTPSPTTCAPTCPPRSSATWVSKLGQEVKDVDARMDEHVHSVFDHRLGHLADSAASAVELSAAVQGPIATDQVQASGENMAASLVAMLSKPDGVRQAVLVGEILQRPEQRWRRFGETGW